MAEISAPREWRELCLLGDSIGQGYGDATGLGWFGRLSQKLAEDHPDLFVCHSASMSGDTVLDALHRLAAEVAQREADYLIIAIGVNDVVRRPTADSPTSLAPETSRLAWDSLLRRARRICDFILVVGCGPVLEHRFPADWIPGSPIYYLNGDIRAYNARVQTLCAAQDIPYCDVFPALNQRENLFMDGVHPNADGHNVIADHVYAAMRKEGWLAPAAEI